MNKLGSGISLLVFACAAAQVEAAPCNGDVGGRSVVATASRLSDRVPGHVRHPDAFAQGTGGSGSRVDAPKAAPSGPGLQFHRYPR